MKKQPQKIIKYTQEQKKEILQKSLLELLSVNPEIKSITNYYESINQTKKKDIQIAVWSRVDNTEKINYLKNKIESIRVRLENDMIKLIHTQFSQPLYQIIKAAKTYTNSKDSMKFILSDSSQFESNEFYELIKKSFFEENKLNSDDFNNLISILEKQGDESKMLVAALKSDDFMTSFMTMIYYIDYEYKFLGFLKKTIAEITNPQIVQIKNHLEKIEWLGTQKELGELFVELKSKGWINEIKKDLITKYFTKADSISEVLKPATDKGGKPTYERIYTKAYKKAFNNIAVPLQIKVD